MPPKATKSKPVFDQDNSSHEESPQVNYEEIVKQLVTQMGQTQTPPPKPKQKRVLTEERKEQLREQLAKGREKILYSQTMMPKTNPPEFTTSLEPEPPKKVQKQRKKAETVKVEQPTYSHEKIDELITNIKELTQAQKTKMEKKEKIEREKEEKAREREREIEDEKFLFLPEKKSIPIKQEPPKPAIATPKPAITTPTPYIYRVPKPNNSLNNRRS